MYRSQHWHRFHVVPRHGLCSSAHMDLYLPQDRELMLHTHTGKAKGRLTLWNYMYVIYQASVKHTLFSCRMHLFSSHTQIRQPREYKQVQHDKAEKCFMCVWKPYQTHSNKQLLSSVVLVRIGNVGGMCGNIFKMSDVIYSKSNRKLNIHTKYSVAAPVVFFVSASTYSVKIRETVVIK